MKKNFYILAFLLLPLTAFANGDPVAEYCALTLSKVPVPRAIPEIQIEREDLQIELLDGCSHIQVDYVLHNTSKKTFRNIHYGFPVDWEGDGPIHWTGDFISESLYQKGWSDDYVTNFSFRLDGKLLSAHMSGDTLIRPAYTTGDWHKEYGYPNWQVIYGDTILGHDDYGEFEWIMSELEWEGKPTDSTVILKEPLHRRWYYTSFSICANQTVTLHVEYTLRHWFHVSLSDPENEFCHYFDESYYKYDNNYKEVAEKGRNRFIYDYSPAAAWGDGTAHELNLNINAPGVSVWNSQIDYRDSALFKDSYQQHYTHFDYAKAEPLKLAYFYPRPDSLDVNAIRDHRLPANRYQIMQYDNDANHYDALKDLSGCTGVELTPTDSGNYVLDILINEPAYITGIAIMNGNCCDSLSWASNGRIEQMQIMYKGLDWQTNKDVWITTYGITEWVVKYIQSVHHPAPCKNTMPDDFSWNGLVRAADKTNVYPRVSQAFYPHDRFWWQNPIRYIRIIIPPQERAPFISEVILLYDE